MPGCRPSAVQETLSCSSWKEQSTESRDEATGALIDVAEGVLSLFRSVDSETGVGGEGVLGFRTALEEGPGIGVSTGFVTGTFTEGD